MSYQVLARKYRPGSFSELEGQEHVLRALINALDNDRLHHAYLFTGTRGVGKTTIARILARCLNCDEGISSVPCGKCSTCREISEGRSVDLIEVDAASRTKVEDTRELLDNVQYLPSKNRFKIYLIDEVHMLSNHSFNALLKTLEEPPEHVKFLLATTDPKKLPVTVLSRCLQFNLKNLSPERIVSYLQQILVKEQIEFEEPALWQIGRAADGSMRDALSLTDQAISYGNDAVRDAEVKTMLGSIDRREVFGLVDGLINQDASQILGKIAELAEYSPDYGALLAELLVVFHRVTLAHAMPDDINNSEGDQALVAAVASALSREDVQLYYQIGLLGQRDLSLAPDMRSGFEMVMLRMLTFTPNSQTESGSTEKKTVKFDADGKSLANLLTETNLPAKSGTPKSATIESTTTNNAIKRVKPPVNIEAEDSTIIDFGDDDAVVAPNSGLGVQVGSVPPQGPVAALSEIVLENAQATDQTVEAEVNSEVQQAARPAARRTSSTSYNRDKNADAIPLEVSNWARILPALGLAGVTLSVASNCVLASVSESSCTLNLNDQHASLWNQSHESRIEKALSRYYGKPITLVIEIGQFAGETPAQLEEQRQKDALDEAVKLIESDAKVKQLIDSFDGTLDKETITARH